MAEDAEGLDSGAEASLGGVDPAAMALGLAGASRRTADAFLEDQRSLIAIQKHHLHEQFKQLRLAIWQQRMGVLLRVATALMGIAVAAGLGFMVWQASQSNGLIVEPFSVPPDLAAQGLTGQVVAARVLDRLTLLQTQTNTSRPAQSYRNDWSARDIKLEIPETGVSLVELDNWLRQKLGHDTYVTGEIVHMPSGISITARAGAEGAESVSSPAADVDVLASGMGDAIYRITQPYRYAIYLMRQEKKPAEAAPIFKKLALNGSPDDRYWSYNMWAQAESLAQGDAELGLKMYQQAHAADPNALVVYVNLIGSLNSLGRYEEALQAFKEFGADLAKAGRKFDARTQANLDQYMGAYHDATPVNARLVQTGAPGIPADSLLRQLILSQAGEHDLTGARASLAQYPPDALAPLLDLLISYDGEDWKRALQLGDAMADYLKANPHDRHFAIVIYAPPLALAQASLGDFAAAERTIAPTPGDCYPCLIIRARIAALQGQSARADWWFARAAAAGPSFPFAFNEWGKVLLARGQPDAAIAKFITAHGKTPHFADPLEGWGEALMAKKASGAAAKFEEADKYAPNWGRLHLKWGEALAYAGKADEAKKQFALAAGLDLTAAEKIELAGRRN